jgi:hypothetical protein
MEIKYEVAVSGAWLAVESGALRKTGASRTFADAVKVLHVFPSVGHWDTSTAPLLISPDRHDFWETASYLALSAGGLLAIGLSLFD